MYRTNWQWSRCRSRNCRLFFVVCQRFRLHGSEVTLTGLDRRSSAFYDRLTGTV